MARFAVGQKVFQTRGTFLHEGVFILPKTPLTVLRSSTGPDGRALYDLQYLDRESMPHTLVGIREDELTEAT